MLDHDLVVTGINWSLKQMHGRFIILVRFTINSGQNMIERGCCWDLPLSYEGEAIELS
jgi:hypothetical protein